MLFNSLEYIFLFLPITVVCYFLLNHKGYYQAALVWLVVASLGFYAYWKPVYLLLITGSVSFNYLLGGRLQKAARRSLLVFGIVINLGLLAWFKYANFIAANINEYILAHTDFFINLPKIELPLAISFFTFLQIAYLVDCFQGKVRETHFLHYTLFVTYFPHLIAGPLVHHQELMPEFARAENKRVNWNHIYLGIYVFAIGLFKKVFIADSFAEWARMGFDSATSLTFFDAWGSSLSYTLQLYFDFSGYTDMAIGASMILNIKLPINFNSPYKALDIQDFWRRWHMTLSRWLREYLYIPLGGNRSGSFFTGVNLFITFLLGGLWHGANWTFVIWGAMHGGAVVIHRIWKHVGGNLPRYLAWFLTFMFANIAWVFFRAHTVTDSLRILRGMIDIHSIAVTANFAHAINYFTSAWPIFQLTGDSPHTLLLPVTALIYLAIFLPICLLTSNSHEIALRSLDQRPTLYSCARITILAAIPLFMMLYFSSRISEFIYFNF